MPQPGGSPEQNGEFSYEEESTHESLFDSLLNAEQGSTSDADDEVLGGIRKLAQIRRHDAEAPTEEDFRQIVRIALPNWLRRAFQGEQWEAMTADLAATLYNNPDWNDRLVALWRRLLSEVE